MIYLSDYFLMDRIPLEEADSAIIVSKKVSMEDIPMDAYSIIADKETARILSSLLKRNIEFNNEKFLFNGEDIIYTVQYRSNADFDVREIKIHTVNCIESADCVKFKEWLKA